MKTQSLIALSAIAVSVTAIGLATGTKSGRERPAADEKAVKPEKTRLHLFMRGKLAASQNVLEGLVTEDFDKIQKGGKKMVAMSLAADWKVLQSNTYAQYSGEFHRSATRLVSMAKKKQLDSAALSYMHVTMTCINCHKYVKKEKIALGEPISPGLKFAVARGRLWHYNVSATQKTETCTPSNRKDN